MTTLVECWNKLDGNVGELSSWVTTKDSAAPEGKSEISIEKLESQLNTLKTMFAEKQKLVAGLETYGAGHGGGAAPAPAAPAEAPAEAPAAAPAAETAAPAPPQLPGARGSGIRDPGSGTWKEKGLKIACPELKQGSSQLQGRCFIFISFYMTSSSYHATAATL